MTFGIDTRPVSCLVRTDFGVRYRLEEWFDCDVSVGGLVYRMSLCPTGEADMELLTCDIPDHDSPIMFSQVPTLHTQQMLSNVEFKNFSLQQACRRFADVRAGMMKEIGAACDKAGIPAPRFDQIKRIG